MFRLPATLFDHLAMSFHPQPHVPTSQLAASTHFNAHQPFQAPQVPKHAYKQSYACFLYIYFFFGFDNVLFVFFFFFFSPPRNACTSHRTCVSYFFSFFFFSPLRTRVQAIVHVFLNCFLFFSFFSPPRNACTSNHTRVSRIHFFLRPPRTCVGMFHGFVFFFFFLYPWDKCRCASGVCFLIFFYF
jgi:hypothetical protein